MNIDIALARIAATRKRAVSMLAIYRSNEKPSTEITFTSEELKDLDSMLTSLAIKLTGKDEIPEDTWYPPVNYAYRHGYGKTPLSWLECLVRALDDSALFFSSLQKPAPINKSSTSPWSAGSFYLVSIIALIVTIRVTFGQISAWWLPVTLVFGIIGCTVVGALQLKNNDIVSEEGFLKIMALVFRSLPLIRRVIPRKEGPTRR